MRPAQIRARRRRAALAIPCAIALAVGIAAGPAAIAPDATAADTQGIAASRRTAVVTAAERLSPAVVSVSVTATRIVRTDPFPGMFRDEFFERFFPPTEYRQRVPSMGSGVIVDAAGLVITNEHVTRNADQIQVTLTDGRQFPARLLGATDLYDLAVLKIEGPNLPAAPLGDSDKLLVGEWAIAIGNPFGYLLYDNQPTVTVGVISAMNRDIKTEAGAGVYRNMIQTDAAINPGNSGGPLANAEGEVIGINAFIFTQTGGSIGLGFAIPINLAKRVMNEIKNYGRVRAAYPGMGVQPLTAELARRLGYDGASGLVVTRIDPGGPAAKAGVKVGDRIRRVNRVTVSSVEDAQRGIYGAYVGDKLTLGIERGNTRLDLTMVLAEAPGGGR